jgi:hypothetical protein
MTQTDKEKETCLKCLDSGWVYINDPRNEEPGSEKMRCPMGCETKEGK